MKVVVTSAAVNTWLEPYIGMAFEFVRYKNRQIYFLINRGAGPEEEKHDFELFISK